jgi:putative FmdB family regulatory protein
LAVPTYDYQCRSCGTITEVIHSMLEDGPSVCERCGGDLRRVLYPAGIIFKGPGFYSTDSRNGSSKTVTGTASSSKGSGAGGSSDSKASSPSTGGESSSSAPSSSTTGDTA